MFIRLHPQVLSLKFQMETDQRAVIQKGPPLLMGQPCMDPVRASGQAKGFTYISSSIFDNSL